MATLLVPFWIELDAGLLDVGSGLAKDERGSFGWRLWGYGKRKNKRQGPAQCAADECQRFFPRTWTLYALLL